MLEKKSNREGSVSHGGFLYVRVCYCISPCIIPDMYFIQTKVTYISFQRKG